MMYLFRNFGLSALTFFDSFLFLMEYYKMNWKKKLGSNYIPLFDYFITKSNNI